MGLLDTLGRLGHRVVGGIDNAAYNSLGGGLLGNALPPQQGYPMDEVPRPQQGGLIGDAGSGEAPEYTANTPQGPQQQGPQQAPPQQWQPNPQQRAQLRGQYLGAIGSALSKAAYGQPLDLAGSLQEYQRNAVGQIQAGQQAQLGQQRQRRLAQFQQEAAAASGNPQAMRTVAAKWAPYFPKEVQDLGASVKALAPKEDDVVGAPFPGVGPDGKPAMLQHTKSGKVIPIQGYSPQESFSTDGSGNMYNTRTGEIAHPNDTPERQAFNALMVKHKGDAAAAMEEMKSFGKNDPKDNMIDLAMKAANGDQEALKAVRLLHPAQQGGGVQLTPDAVKLLTNSVLAGATLPTFGRNGGDTIKTIYNQAAASQPGADLAGAKTDYAANKGALGGLVKQQANVGAFEKTTNANLDLVDSLSKKVDRTGSPVVNRFLLQMKGQYGGDTDTQLLNNAVETAASEYAKVMSGGMAGPVSDSARAHAREMLSSAMGKGTITQVKSLMQQEMNNRNAGFASQIQDLKAGRQGQQPAPQQQGGKISVTAPDGSVHPFATQAQADAFKKLAGIR